MIRLTPFAETISGQELIKNERIANWDYVTSTNAR